MGEGAGEEGKGSNAATEEPQAWKSELPRRCPACQVFSVAPGWSPLGKLLRKWRERV